MHGSLQALMTEQDALTTSGAQTGVHAWQHGLQDAGRRCIPAMYLPPAEHDTI
jgi:hypothetical protein